MDNKIMALKVIKKKNIERKRQFDQIFNEKNILVAMSHPFIIKLYQTF